MPPSTLACMVVIQTIRTLRKMMRELIGIIPAFQQTQAASPNAPCFLCPALASSFEPSQHNLSRLGAYGHTLWKALVTSTWTPCKSLRGWACILIYIHRMAVHWWLQGFAVMQCQRMHRWSSPLCLGCRLWGWCMHVADLWGRRPSLPRPGLWCAS